MLPGIMRRGYIGLAFCFIPIDLSFKVLMYLGNPKRANLTPKKKTNLNSPFFLTFSSSSPTVNPKEAPIF
jgi:hypothetical protein